jgi:hypothetical protein
MIKPITAEQIKEKIKTDQIKINNLVDYINKEIQKSTEKDINFKEFSMYFNTANSINDNIKNAIIKMYQDAGWKNVSIINDDFVSIRMSLY